MTTRKSLGDPSRLGRRERCVLQAFYKLAEGKIDRIVFKTPLLKEFGDLIDPSPQDIGRLVRVWEKEKNLYYKAFLRLVRRGLVAAAELNVCFSTGEPITTHLRKRGNRAFMFTNKGFEAALKLEKGDIEKKCLIEALRQLTEEERICVTLKEIREKLWQTSTDHFPFREKFEEYWTNPKLGLTLKNLGVRCRRAGKKRIRVYSLRVLE